MEKHEQFLLDAHKVLTKEKVIVQVGNLRYKVRQVAQAVKTRIVLLEQEAQILEAQGKQGVSSKEGKRIAKKLYALHSKKAAYYVLGNWALFVPFLWAIKWRILQLRGNEVTYRINEAGVVNADLGFSKANWDISKQERELYMRPVGDVAKQTLERLESVMSMLEKDASGIKEENK